VAVPGEGHEDVGDGEKDYCPHSFMLDAFCRRAVLELWLCVASAEMAESGER
jgi:hypothetical protein